PFWTVEKQRLGPALKPQRANQPDHTEEMIGVKVRKEDFGKREAHAVAHHLALGPLATFEQQRLALAMDGEAGDVAFNCGPGGGRAQESDSEHGPNINAARRGKAGKGAVGDF